MTHANDIARSMTDMRKALEAAWRRLRSLNYSPDDPVCRQIRDALGYEPQEKET